MKSNSESPSKTKREIAQEKAWKLVQSTLNNDEAFFSLKQGLPIVLRGSKGTQFIVYPSGKFVRAGTHSPSIGELQIDERSHPRPDYLATLIAWILHDEDKIDEKWHCGKFTLSDTEEDEEHPQARAELRHYRARQRHNRDWTPTILMMILLILMVALLAPLLFASLSTPIESLVANVTKPVNTTTPTASSPVYLELIAILPIFAVLALSACLIISAFQIMRW